MSGETYTQLRENLTARRKEANLSARQLSAKAGLNESAVKDIESGKSRHPREDTIQRLAYALNCSVGDLMGEIERAGWISDSSRIKVSHTRATRVSVSCVAQPGLWREKNMTGEAELGALLVAPDPEFPDCERYGVLFQGGVADLIAPDGFTGICISLSSLPRGPKIGEIVHVVRRDGRDREETTVRRYAGDPDRPMLESLSSRPELAAPIAPGVDSFGDEVIVVGVVREIRRDVSV
jgi:transcriptional regulator with XRE-family HTH domain